MPRWLIMLPPQLLLLPPSLLLLLLLMLPLLLPLLLPHRDHELDGPADHRTGAQHVSNGCVNVEGCTVCRHLVS